MVVADKVASNLYRSKRNAVSSELVLVFLQRLGWALHQASNFVVVSRSEIILIHHLIENFFINWEDGQFFHNCSDENVQEVMYVIPKTAQKDNKAFCEGQVVVEVKPLKDLEA